ncbi:hypothetical protein [Caulobacter sp. 17J80-11]|uniref:hypothetical protein n=1 Tax=Caulobacter sp. 17J80-11 TaxID=2763502 RepID=UPI0016536741|nr:hypothetical protein [Caulobacter sp. 17J80-11]MBC6981440.1 hypothetical protein [Caulobacter sp. 17J80-11]
MAMISVTGLVGAAALAAYVTAGLELRATVRRLRAEGRGADVLPEELPVVGPRAWAWAFSHRHREVGDVHLSRMVMLWRVAIAALPVGVLALFIGG